MRTLVPAEVSEAEFLGALRTDTMEHIWWWRDDEAGVDVLEPRPPPLGLCRSQTELWPQQCHASMARCRHALGCASRHAVPRWQP